MAQMNRGLDYLIHKARNTTGGGLLEELYMAIGEAGGPEAQEFLVDMSRRTSDSTMTAILYRAIGRASRV